MIKAGKKQSEDLKKLQAMEMEVAKKNIIKSNEAKEYWLKYFKENISFKKISKEEFDRDLKVGIYSHYMTDSNGIIWGAVFEPEPEKEFKQFRRKQIAELRPFQEGEQLSERVSVSQADKEAGSPKVGDMIARNPKNQDDQWLVAKQYFEDNFESVDKENDGNKQAELLGKEVIRLKKILNSFRP
jgi:hypothetical protein